MDVVFLCYAVNSQAETLKQVMNTITQHRITLATTTETTTTATTTATTTGTLVLPVSFNYSRSIKVTHPFFMLLYFFVLRV